MKPGLKPVYSMLYSIYSLVIRIGANSSIGRAWGLWSNGWSKGSVTVETYSRNWIWPRSMFIIGSFWRWNWYSTHINLNDVILCGIYPICKILAKTWHFLFCFGERYSFSPFALTRECALHLRPCEKTRKTYFACGLAGCLQTVCTVPE